jgi:hypothetical protein
MPSYPGLSGLLKGMTPASSSQVFEKRVIPYLVETWLSDYDRATARNQVVASTLDDFTYLFDIAHSRLIAAWGISRGRHAGARDKSRMAGHPLGAGPGFHRGHAIAHTLGGHTDINLVPQRGSVNIGPFRALERLAVATPGALYFTYWRYSRSAGQQPIGVDQGLLCPGRAADIRTHGN